jgi:hypothetical protein
MFRGLKREEKERQKKGRREAGRSEKRQKKVSPLRILFCCTIGN